MPQPQKIAECISLLNDSNTTLEKINTRITQLIQSSELFNLLNCLCILLESQIFNQTQTLTLCYILSKQYPITQNPFFPILKKQYLKSEEFDRNFIATLMQDSSPIQSKSISQVIGDNTIQNVSIDLNKLSEEYEKNLPINIPSIPPVFSDPDESGSKEKDLQKLFEHQLPPAILPPQNHPAPLLMSPGHDELMFLLPEIDFSPMFIPTQITPEIYALIEKAENGKLSNDEKKLLLEKMNDENVIGFFNPSKLRVIYEQNRELVDDIIRKVLKTEYEEAFMDAFNQLPISVDLVKSAHTLVSSSPQSFTRFVENVVEYCLQNKGNVKSFIEKVVAFFEVYALFLIQKGGVVTQKLKVFCDEFATEKNINSLKSILK